MVHFLAPGEGAAYEAFLQRHPLGNFMQSLSWPAVKTNWAHQTVLSLDPYGEIRGGMLVLFLQRPGERALLYAPHGPVCCWSQECLQDLLQGVRVIAEQTGPALFRADPLILAGDEKAIAVLRESGLTFRPGASAKEAIQPRFNYRLPLEGHGEEEIFLGLGSNTRRKIRKALRDGVVCRVAERGELEAYYRMFVQTSLRQGFPPRPKEYLVRLLDAFGRDARLYLCCLNGAALCGAVAIHFGRYTHFVYGASARQSREHYPCYLMQWEMIRWALENGSQWYDFGGVCIDEEEDPSLYRVYQFKKQFHGETVEYAGVFETLLG